MSKRPLYREAADKNPFVITPRTPTERLQTEFPIRSDFSAMEAMVRPLLAYLFAIAALAPLLPVLLIETKNGLFVLVGFFGLLAMAAHIHRKFGTIVSLILFAGVVIASVSFFAQFSDDRAFAASVTAGHFLATVISLLLLGYAVRRFWLELAASGMRTPEEKKRITWAKFPKGFKGKPGGFYAALIYFLSYDLNNTRAKGVHKSELPAVFRISMFVVTVFLVAGIVAVVSIDAWTGRNLAKQSLTDVVQQEVSDTAHGHNEDKQSSSDTSEDSDRLIGLGISMAMPVLLVLAVCCLFTIGCADEAYAALDNQFAPEEWSHFIRTLHSPRNENRFERKSIFWGRVHHDGSPIFIPADATMQHVWLQGAAGSGKTALLMQLAEQYITLGYSVVVLDLKATSNELYWSADEAAKRVRTKRNPVPVYPFTTLNGQPTHHIDLYQQPFWKTRSPEEKASGILGVFGLNYPSVYGQDWFRDCAWAVSQHTTNKFPNLKSFYDFDQRLGLELKHAQEPWELSKSVKDAGDHPRLMLHRIGLLDAVNHRETFPEDVKSINFQEFFRTPSVLHCALPSEADPIGNPEIGRLILAALFSTAANMKSRPTKVVVIIDEFQRMVSHSLDMVIQQARSSDIGLIFANQTTSDLMLPNCNLVETLAGNTCIQAWLKTTDIGGINHIIKTGGTYIEELYSRSTSINGKGEQSTQYGRQEQILDRVSPGLIDEVNASQDRFFMKVTENVGYASYGSQLFVAQSMFHTSQKEHRERSKPGRWPEKTREMLVNGEHRPDQGPPPNALTGNSNSPNSPRPSKTQPVGPSKPNSKKKTA